MMKCSRKWNIAVMLSFYMLLASVFFTPTVLAQNTRSVNLFFGAPPIQIKEGEKVTIDVKINSPEQSINAVSGTLFFPAELVHIVSFVKDKSIINLWTQEPKLVSNRILFEGIILNPGFQGSNGHIFSIVLEARNKGTVTLEWNEGSALANDGLGTNVLATLGKTFFKIISNPTYFQNKPIAKPLIVPVITKYFPVMQPKETLYLRGKGEPSALTKIVFDNLSVKSIGEKLLALLQTKKEEPNEVVVKNDKEGIFRYVNNSDLVAGTYNATPFLVNSEENTELPGPSIQLLVNDSEIIKILVVVLNVMGLLIPIVLLGVIIYFIPWYSWRKIRLMKGKMKLEEEKIELSEEELKQKPPIPNP